MSYYWDDRFLKHIRTDQVRHICEVGARYGDESIMLSNIFTNAKIYSFECNPVTVETCRNTLSTYPNINFFDYGLGEQIGSYPFYSFMCGNDGASSLLKRIDFDETQKLTGYINIRKFSDIAKEESIPYLNLLCMDVQGFEMNILKGCEDFLSRIQYIIMEEPKPIINTYYLPPDTHSKYVGCPTSDEIKQFMTANNFVEIERIPENAIEDNVMYKNTHFM
jgi:FkbM family methyltransferase